MKRLLTASAVALATVPATWSLAAPETPTARATGTASVQQAPTLPPLPAEVRARGRWVIGVKCDVPPFGYLNARGEKAGFEVDVARQFAQIAFGDRRRVDLVCVTTPSREPTLQARTVDMVLATFTWTQDRATRIDFSLPYYANGGRFAVPRTSGIKAIADLAGKTVMTTVGSNHHRWASSCLKGPQLLVAESFAATVAALRDGRAHAIMSDEAFLLNLIATNPTFGSCRSRSFRFLSASPCVRASQRCCGG